LRGPKPPIHKAPPLAISAIKASHWIFCPKDEPLVKYFGCEKKEIVWISEIRGEKGPFGASSSEFGSDTKRRQCFLGSACGLIRGQIRLQRNLHAFLKIDF